ncbi:MAG: hypothetical protein QOH97_4074 [Actinoplanes sp.]|jgi:soluble lytic murein transglycosylase-like protein|nr:hypothetical protein [Actinoplanes sp.]
MYLGVQGVLSRISELNQQLGLTPPAATSTGPAFASALAEATTTAPATTVAAAATTATATSPRIPAAEAVGNPALGAPRPAALQNGNPLDAVPYADMFVKAGARYGVSARLLAAVAKVESGYDPQAVSGAGAQGLMQLMPGTAAGLGVQDPFDPQDAIMGGARLLAQNLREFGSVPLALAAYNAGGGAVRRYGGIPPFAETRAYVPRVQNALAALGG